MKPKSEASNEAEVQETRFIVGLSKYPQLDNGARLGIDNLDCLIIGKVEKF